MAGLRIERAEEMPLRTVEPKQDMQRLHFVISSSLPSLAFMGISGVGKGLACNFNYVRSARV
jgi:hypothetical protein